MVYSGNKSPFHKILVPVVFGYPYEAALGLACRLTTDQNITVVGMVTVARNGELSAASLTARRMRTQIRKLSQDLHCLTQPQVLVSSHPWQELIGVINHENPDLLLLEWPVCFEALQISAEKAFPQAPCDIGLVRGPIPQSIERILVPLRGGVNAEQVLRIAISLARYSDVKIRSLHLVSKHPSQDQEAAYRGLSQVLSNLPEIEQREKQTEQPADTILQAAEDCNLLIVGASARTAPNQPAIGPVAERLLQECPLGMVVVKTARKIPEDMQNEIAGSTAISVLVDKWFAENTYHSNEFANLHQLLELKEQQNLTISLALPSLNEEQTVGNVIETIKSALMDKVPLLDEMVLMDSDSTDRTRLIAEELSIPVYIHQEILPKYGSRRGKGEALWKSLYVTHGDILLWIDTDISNIHPRFVFGLIGALLNNPDLVFVKGFYRRPLRIGDKIQVGGGGRVTELTARPLLNLFYPELSGIVQPLSGEYGGRRSALEQLPFFSGYGVEIGLLIDIFEEFGVHAIAQVDLKERIHHNQPLEALSKMSFAIIQAVTRKLEGRFDLGILEEVNKTMKLIRYSPGRLFLDVEEIAELERPPMIEVPEYRERFSR